LRAWEYQCSTKFNKNRQIRDADRPLSALRYEISLSHFRITIGQHD